MSDVIFFQGTEPRFTRGEYWVLEIVVEAGMPIAWLASDSLSLIVNKTSHGLDLPELIETLDRLFSNGLIVSCKQNEVFKPTRKQIEAALEEKDRRNFTYYELSAEGGKAWEAFARPDWNIFIGGGSEVNEPPTPRRAELISMNQKRLERYFQGIHHLKWKVDPTTIVRDELRPWQATYWKELPLGYRICFEYEEIGNIVWDEIPLTYYWLHEHRWYRWR